MGNSFAPLVGNGDEHEVEIIEDEDTAGTLQNNQCIELSNQEVVKDTKLEIRGAIVALLESVAEQPNIIERLEALIHQSNTQSNWSKEIQNG